ncbi:MAG: hypothetical protein ACKOW8_04710, partial [Flavobacteriales bacterium]
MIFICRINCRRLRDHLKEDAAKYASSLYGPFRDAVGSRAALGAGDKRTY